MNTRNTKTKLLIGASMLTAVFGAGCSNESADLKDAVNGFDKACKGAVSAEFYAGTFHKSLTLRCDNFDAAMT